MSLQQCLEALCAGRNDCVAFSGSFLYQLNWVRPYNLDIPVEPVAVLRPESAEEVAAAVKCAVEFEVPVQAKSGGHSYAYVETHLPVGDTTRRLALTCCGTGTLDWVARMAP
jgi:FAD/FMN-containing dehydrogenase